MTHPTPKRPFLPGIALMAVVAALGSSPAAAQGLYHLNFRSPADHVQLFYDLWLPPGMSPGSAVKRPTVLFLHGRGGTERQFQEGGDYQVEANTRGFILVFWGGRRDPNGLLSTYYVDAPGLPDETDILGCLDDAAARFPVDPDRVHIAGFSQGGKGALLIGLKNAGRFASIVSGAGPSDAFQGQTWSPTFPDFIDAAGGPYQGANAGVLARWYAQSPRFYLENARNLPVGLFHGTLDDVVPDSPALFPYRNTHHIADVPGFTDARGRRPTLSELHAADPAGYAFEAHFIAGAGHEQFKVLDPAAVFDFLGGKARPASPGRVVAVTFDTTERAYYWARLGRASPPSGIPAGLDARADIPGNRIVLDLTGSPAVTLDGAAAGLDTARPFEVEVHGGAGASLKVLGAFGEATRVSRGTLVLRSGIDYTRDAGAIQLSGFDAGASSILTFEPALPEIAESDLLVPVLVHSGGLNGAFFASEVTLFNADSSPLTVEALLVDGSGARTTIDLAGGRTVLLTSADLLARLGKEFAASPLRLRVLAGSRPALMASARAFNRLATGGTYGAGFPVKTAGESTLSEAPSTPFYLYGGDPAHPSRFNVSFFAPFEDVELRADAADFSGGAVATTISLPRLQRVQLNDVFAGLTEPAAMKLSLTKGRVQVYGTVVSNSPTNDPFLSLPQSRLSATYECTVPAVASADGLFNAHFSSDLFARFSPEDPAGPPDGYALSVLFRPRAGGPPRGPYSILGDDIFGPHLFTDVLTRVFPADVPAAGALEITASHPAHVFAVTRSQSPGGQASQDMPCVPAGQEITHAAPAAFVGLAQSGKARSNLVLVNKGPATVVSLFLYAEDGPRETISFLLAQGEVKQIDGVADPLGLAPTEAAALLVLPDAVGRLVATVSRLDNLTNDPSGLAPIAWPLASPGL
jgi:poly(3-hydroxybutyrate) depolymerase